MKKLSIVVPVYKNRDFVNALIATFQGLAQTLSSKDNAILEVVFVVDGSPDDSYAQIKQRLPQPSFEVQLIAHSRNFGSFAAIRTGLAHATGEYMAVMAADLQEPPELVLDFYDALSNDRCDVVLGVRNGRKDPLLSRLSSGLFWWFYKRWIVPEMPVGGVDIFACNRQFCTQLLKLEESRSSLIALILWLGFRREFVFYERQERKHGKSGWTLSKKIDYMLDSIFSFTDKPVRWLMKTGFLGMGTSLILSVGILIAHLSNQIQVSGYVPIMLSILFFGALNLFALGLVGTYAWRSYENTKSRPLSVVALRHEYPIAKERGLVP
jgi:polyisoprenyl-phosphate glycosyltransferase